MAVYLVCAAAIMGDPGPVKIGYSDDSIILKRLSVTQTGNHLRLRLVQVVEGGRKVEKALHDRFALLRLHGEWFDHDPAMEGDLGLPAYAPSLEWRRPWPIVAWGGPVYREASRLLRATPEHREKRRATRLKMEAMRRLSATLDRDPDAMRRMKMIVAKHRASLNGSAPP